MPVLEKLKEDLSYSPPQSTYITDVLKQQNGSVAVDYSHVDNENNHTFENLSKSKSNNSSSKLSFKKKASNPNLKHKSDDPFRFGGDGVDFKAKLIGYQDVDEPRGDQMCQDALQLCKAIVKRKGEHKQRIFFNISLDGLKIKEQSNAKILYEFPVAKVSFIAKDVSDNRAFGFVYGVSEDHHKFYAIKTEKTADQVVFSIRDMFQIVYEMKKKQIEQAKQQQDDTENNKKENVNGSIEDVPVANLLDLESELENLEQGMQNMEKWTPVEESTENGSLSSPASMPSMDSSGWATTSHSSSALNESSDPFTEHIFTSSLNSGGSISSHSKEMYVPPPPSASNSRRISQNSSSNSIGHSTLFGATSDPFMTPDPFENGVARTNVLINGHAPSLASSNDPFDTSHVNKMILHNNTLDGSAVHPNVSTPLQSKTSNGWIANGLRPSMIDTSQCPSAIQAASFGDDFSSANGSVFVGLNGSCLIANGKMTESPSMFNNAATNSSMFNTSTFDSTSGAFHESRSNDDFLYNARMDSKSSPLSILRNSSLSSPANSLSNGSSTKQSMEVGSGKLVETAFAKLCNLDTLVITPSRPPQQVNGFTMFDVAPVPQVPKRDDPFAHLKYKPKKTINELREMTAGPTLNGLETLVNGSPQNNSPPTTLNQNQSSSSSPPRIPPRSGQNFPAIPRPSSDIGRNGHGLLPPPMCGAATRMFEPKHDPFADEFFA